MELPKVTILLPTHNDMPYIVHTVDSIINNTFYPFKLLIIESESTDGTARYCDWLKINYSNTISVIHTKKEGMVKAVNIGLNAIKEGVNTGFSAIKGGDVFLTHADVIFPKLYARNWLFEFVKLALIEDTGLVTSLFPTGGGISGPDYINNFIWVGTWACYIPRRTLDKIGIMDENYNPGMGDDIDYSWRVVNVGLQLRYTNFSIEHHRMKDYPNERIEGLKEKHADYFRKKLNLGEFKE
jgi:GT2 family glycosyltransferase